MASSLRKLKTATVPQPLTQRPKAPHLHVVLQPTRSLKVLTTSPQQRFSAKLQRIIKFSMNLALLGLLGAAVSYFALISVEFEVNQNLRQLELQMKNREDLKSYLGKVYSWSNLNTEAKKSKMVEAKKIEIASTQKTAFHNLFDFQN